MDDRHAALCQLYESVKSRLPKEVPMEKFIGAFSLWHVHPLRRHGVIVGAIVSSGPELHIGMNGHALRRGDIKATLASAIARFGYAMTSVAELGNEKGLAFAIRLGFVETKRVNGTIYLRCEETHYE